MDDELEKLDMMIKTVYGKKGANLRLGNSQ